MTIPAIIINIFVLICIVVSLIKNRSKTVKALKIALIAFLKIIPIVFSIIIVIGLLLTFFTKDFISSAIGAKSGALGVLIAALMGSIMHIPALIAFPLSSALLKEGASIAAVAAFITTLTMIGFFTLPLEIKELGKKFALLRNGLSIIIALIIAILMGILL